MSKRFFAILITLSCLVVVILPHPARAQDPDPGWRVESVRPLTEIIEDSTNPMRIYLAPDGHQLAYEERGDDSVGVCVLDVTNPVPRCVFMPKETAYGFPYSDMFPALRWSPDSQQIALVGMPYQYFKDTDLGLVDFTVSDPAFTQLIDDGFNDNLLEMTAGASVEVNPAFSPDGTQIAVEQAVAIQDNVLITSISLIDIATGTSTALARLPGHKEYERDMGTTISMEWSPDGTTLAISSRHQRFEPAYDGIWLVDVATGDLTQVITRDDLLSFYQVLYPNAPEDAIDIIAPVRWSPDGSRLLFWAGAPFQYIGQVWAFWYDIESGDIHPVPLPITKYDGENSRGLWPAQAVWSPDGSTLLVVARLTVSPEVEETDFLIASDEPPFFGLYMIDIETESYMLLGYLPQGVGQLFYAQWGPENDVFAGGYYLKLAQD